jgi:type 1 glutamine amidotransferase
MRSLLAVTAAFALSLSVHAANKKLLFVTHSGGFIHDSLGVAEDVMREIGPKHGYDVTCWRYTGDPAEKGFAKIKNDFRARTGKTIEPENCGRINKETLKNFDAVLFFTTGSGPKSHKKDIGPMNEQELAEFTEWLKGGGAFAGVHCATDTLYDSNYGKLIGGYFVGHPHIQDVKLKVEDPKHAVAAGMTDGMKWNDEFYIMADQPYSRKDVHVIISIDKDTFNIPKPRKSTDKPLARADGDYPVCWVKEEGKGKVFYTSLGHRKEVWKDERYQNHVFAGIDWAVNKK